MSEPEDFYQEALQWLEANCPASQRTPASRAELVYGGRKCEFPSEDARVWLERMAGRGWTVPTWPVEYGGAGLSPEHNGQLQKALTIGGGTTEVQLNLIARALDLPAGS
jgi:alkylation response protein AidB-like acyl-CoA dehydrogenase